MWFQVGGAIVVALIGAAGGWFVQRGAHTRAARDEATRILRQFRDPLLAAAFDLQSRLYNIVLLRFLERYWLQGTEEEREYALWSTLWLFGQYVGWVEIIRRELQFLDLGSNERNRVLQRRIGDITEALASDATSETFVMYRSEQRGVGEFMVSEQEDKDARPVCLNYSRFVTELEKAMATVGKDPAAGRTTQPPHAAWAIRFRGDLDDAAEYGEDGADVDRLIAVQRRLIDLIDHLDPDRVRYPDLDHRGKLPAVGADPEQPGRLARFVDEDKPWDKVETWASRHELLELDEFRKTDERVYVLPRRGPRRVALYRIRRDDRWIEVYAWYGRRRALPFDGDGTATELDHASAPSKERAVADDLLDRFGRPRIWPPRERRRLHT